MTLQVAARPQRDGRCRPAWSGRCLGTSHLEPKRLRFIDALRAIAALWVVLFHFGKDNQFEAAARCLPVGVVDWVFMQGHLGVWIFFVVSGFVMALAVERRPVDAAFALRLMLRRLMRLTPPYYASIVVVLALVALRSSLRHGPLPSPGVSSLASHLLYVEDFFGVPELNVVYWTLTVEVQFYIAFVATMWCCDRIVPVFGARSPSRTIRIAILGCISLAALPWSLRWLASPSLPMFVAFWHAFLAGVLSFRSVRHGRPEQIALGAYVLLLFAVALNTHSAAPVAVALTALAIAVMGAMQRLTTAFDWRPLQFVGMVSYSLYLLHDPLISAVGSVTRHTLPPGVWRDVVGLVASLAASLAAAVLLWRLVERPSQHWSRLMTTRR